MLDPSLAAMFAAADPDAPGFEDMPLADVRAAVAGLAEVCGPGLPVASVRDLVVPRPGAGPADPGVRCRLHHPPPGRALPLLVFLFGGGFVAGSVDVVDTPLRQVAVLGRSAVLAVDYRLAPETRWPGPVDDAVDAVRWAAGHAAELGVRSDAIGVGGDSAGGGLAAQTALRLRADGLLAAQLLIYPALDVDFESPSYRAHADGPLITRAAMRRFWAEHLGGPDLLARPPAGAVPARAPDLTGLPPALIAVSEVDPLRSDGERYAAALTAAGVPTELLTWPGMTHASWYFDRVSPAAAGHNQDLARRIGRTLRGVSEAPEPPPVRAGTAR